MIFLIFFLLYAICDAVPGLPGHYECGVHGRFEYCLDNFPGCVIGCHCYPGYYFDTDSKICEPNTKLTQDYRRHLSPAGYTGYGQGSALALPIVPPPPPEVPSTPEPAPEGDNGDLSDWLYNQFFKTIESQVVNKTDDEPLKPGTRRSSAPMEPFFSRRHSSKKKKSKKRNSRKKTIRDDEEDSEEDSSGSDSSESDSDESKGDLGSWERFEWGPRPPSPNGSPDLPKDGAHRQIVMYSKKPKPPLPSFIFLPNMGTAFYPPIGLPAPAIPMYPMVPIPPIPQAPSNNNENEQTTAAASTQHPATSAPPATPAGPPSPSPPPPPPSPPPPSPPTTEQTTEAPTEASPVPNENNKKVLRTHKMLNTFHPPIKTRNKPPPRAVFKPSPLPPLPPMDYPMKQYVPEDNYDDMFLGDNNLIFDHGDKMDTGNDFKYISELIHRNPNETNKVTSRSPLVRIPLKHEQFQRLKPKRRRHPIAPGRLDYSTRRLLDSTKNKEDDTYYSTLGKQIAKLIRGLETEHDLQPDLKIKLAEDPKTKIAADDHPFFSESSYAARTYWERFVRSPLGMRLNKMTKYKDLIASNENLFELENQVQEATSAPSLSWEELENVINTMGAIRNQPGTNLKNNYDKLSNASLNVSLLPRFTAKTNTTTRKPKTNTTDLMFFAEFDKVIDKLTKSNKLQKLSKIMFKNNTQEITKRPKNENNITKSHSVIKIARPVYLNTNINDMHIVVSTLKPIILTSHKKARKTTAMLVNKNHDKNDIEYFNEINKHPHVVQASTFVRSKKYFFDSGTNTEFQFGNWVMA